MSATATHTAFIIAEKPTAARRIAEALDRSIGMDLIERGNALRMEVLIKSTDRSCPVCKAGDLRVLRSKKTRKGFVGCSNYWRQGCGASGPLPQKGKVILVGGACRTCGWPRVKILSKGRRHWMICANPVCPLKETKRSQRNRAVIRVEDMQDR